MKSALKWNLRGTLSILNSYAFQISLRLEKDCYMWHNVHSYISISVIFGNLRAMLMTVGHSTVKKWMTYRSQNMVLFDRFIFLLEAAIPSLT